MARRRSSSPQRARFGRRSPLDRRFGQHVRSCRRARGLSQQELAERSGSSVDTIGRLERGDFSPSLQTLHKLGVGLELSLSTLFRSFELGEPPQGLLDELERMTDDELDALLRFVHALWSLARST